MNKHLTVTSCTYCGQENADTSDHVPPACLFPTPRPPNLITVPCCRACNGEASKDDEYFRMVLAIRRDNEHPAVEKVLESVHRGLGRRQGRGLMADLAQGTRPVSVRSPGGLHLGNSLAYTVDLNRMGRVASRTVKGLFFKEFGKRLPDSYDVQPFASSGLHDIDSKLWTAVKQRVHGLLSCPPRIVGDSVFEYRFQTAADDPMTTAWLMCFYKVEWFLCFTFLRNAKPAAT